MLTLGVAPYADAKYAASFRANAFFIGQSLRGAVNEARADYTPIFLSQVPALFKSRRVPIDVALIMVSPPDEHGFCSLGVSVDITKTATEAAKSVIAQVNRCMPRALGDCFLHVDQINFLVEHHEPLLEWPVVGEPDDVTERIAEHVARLVPDGATLQLGIGRMPDGAALQLGIGRMPDAVLHLLDNKNDLGIHTEMFSERRHATGRLRSLPESRHAIDPRIQAIRRPRGLSLPACPRRRARLDFYVRAFGAEELFRLTEPSGRIGHAEIRIGRTTLMLSDEYPEMSLVGPQALGGTTFSIHLHVDDADAWIARAVDAGATVIRPAKDAFYGERSGTVRDPFGHEWMLGHQIEEVSTEEMQRRYTKLFEA